MKKFLVIAAMSAAVFGATSAAAGPAAVTRSNTLDVQEVRDRTMLQARAAENLFKAIRGSYSMSDGTTLHVYRSSYGYIAQVSGEAPRDVVVTRNEKFVAPDGAIELRFVKNSGGLYEGVVLSKPATGGTSVASVQSIKEG